MRDEVGMKLNEILLSPQLPAQNILKNIERCPRKILFGHGKVMGFI